MKSDFTTNEPTLLVMAAGMGNRYGGLKQMAAMGPSGETLLDYSVYDALRAGFTRAVFIIRKAMEADFRAIADARFGPHIQYDLAFQEIADLPTRYTVPEGRTKPWGTTQAVLSAAHLISGNFAVINADDFYGAASYQALSDHWRSGSQDAALLGFTLRNTLSENGSVARALCGISADGMLNEIVEQTSIERFGNGATVRLDDGSAQPLTGDETVSMNMWGFPPSIFPLLAEAFERFLSRSADDLKAECYLPNSVHELIAAGQLHVCVLNTHSEWFGVTYKEDLAKVQASLRRKVEAGAYPEKLWD
jgi:dTDP-glucose pyrophosphorylase